MSLTPSDVQGLARQCGFELAGVARAGPAPDADRFHRWVAAGMAGQMHYLTDHRAALRDDPRSLLPSARSVICVGKLYRTPHAPRYDEADLAWISRYAWGDDYHDVLRNGLERLRESLAERTGPFESRICVDTAPILERSWARAAGLGWIGKNTSLIHQGQGSWFFLGELLVSLDLDSGQPAPDRCGTCTRCIEACPTGALTPYTLDSRRCISYFTIELREPVPAEYRAAMGPHVFGCDICQDVCPWNGRAPETDDPAFQPRMYAPPLEKLAAIEEQEFREIFRGSPIRRARYSGFLRNVAMAMGNAGLEKFRGPLDRLVRHTDPVVAEAAQWALGKLPQKSAP
jgi:epoxyqueuosine reductase